MSRPFLVFLVLACSLWPRSGGAGEFNFLPDHPGTASATVTGASTAENGLGPADAAVYQRNLRRLRDALLAQAVFQPPRGILVSGNFFAESPEGFSRSAPVPGQGWLQFYPCFLSRKTGQPDFLNATTDEVVAFVNNPTGGLEPFNCPDCGARWYYEPRRTGEIDGYPVFRGQLGCEHIVLGRDRSAPWVPVTREEFVRVWTRVWEKQNAGNPQDMFKQMIARHQEALAAMSPEQRREQARYQPQEDPLAPQLAPSGSDQGLPLVKAGTGWYDPALPRTAFQLVVVKFWYSGLIDADHPEPAQDGLITGLRVWEALHHSKWPEVAAVLAAGRGPNPPGR